MLNRYEIFVRVESATFRNDPYGNNPIGPVLARQEPAICSRLRPPLFHLVRSLAIPLLRPNAQTNKRFLKHPLNLHGPFLRNRHPFVLFCR